MMALRGAGAGAVILAFLRECECECYADCEQTSDGWALWG
jgi:hypothetical protein